MVRPRQFIEPGFGISKYLDFGARLFFNTVANIRCPYLARPLRKKQWLAELQDDQIQFEVIVSVWLNPLLTIASVPFP